MAFYFGDNSETFSELKEATDYGIEIKDKK
jgi:hypothetical protein